MLSSSEMSRSFPSNTSLNAFATALASIDSNPCDFTLEAIFTPKL